MFSAISGKGDESTIVPVTVISMVSSPPVELASRIACRSVSGPESADLDGKGVMELLFAGRGRNLRAVSRKDGHESGPFGPAER